MSRVLRYVCREFMGRGGGMHSDQGNFPHHFDIEE